MNNGNGNSHANGNVLPLSLRGWEMRELWDAKVSFWTVMA